MASIVTSSLLFGGTNTPGAAGTQSFQNNVSVLTDMFTSGGWVNTNAVGSINTSSVSPPAPSSSSLGGFQVWRFNDWWHNSGSAPVFIRVEYGTFGGDPFGRGAGVGFIVGFSHDGSGTIANGLNGVDTTARLPYAGLAFTHVSGTSYTHRMTIVSASDMAFIFADSFSTNAGMAFVERTKDVNGNPTNEGVFVGAFNGASQVYRQQVLMYSQSQGQTPTPETYPIYISSGRSDSAFNGDVSVSMLVPMMPYGPGYPSRMVGVVRSSDFTTGVTHTINAFGTSSIFFVSANTSFQSMIATGRATAGAGRLLIRAD